MKGFEREIKTSLEFWKFICLQESSISVHYTKKIQCYSAL